MCHKRSVMGQVRIGMQRLRPWRRAAREGLLLAGALLVVLGFGMAAAAIRTSPHDVLALIALRQEVYQRDPKWKGAMDKWPVQTCNAQGVCDMDPCGSPGINDLHEGQFWEGVDCRFQDKLHEDVPRVVTNLHLPKRGLTGPLPSALALLRNITELDFDTNVLTGPVPATWGCLGSLVEIDLSDNSLSGPLPLELGLLHKLIDLELDGNRGLTGCVPPGAPPLERLCGTPRGGPCPSWTTDPLIGTKIIGTGVMPWRCRESKPVAALRAGLRCPTLDDHAAELKDFFDKRDAMIAKAQAKDATTAAAPTAQGTAAGTGATAASSTLQPQPQPQVVAQSVPVTVMYNVRPQVK